MRHTTTVPKQKHEAQPRRETIEFILKFSRSLDAHTTDKGVEVLLHKN